MGARRLLSNPISASLIADAFPGADLHLVHCVAHGRKGPITREATFMAAAWCDLLEQHARRIYQSGTDGDMGPARTLAERLDQSLPTPFSARDVVRKGWAGLGSTEDVEKAIGILEEHGWVKAHDCPPDPKAGGRPTVKYYANNLREEEVDG